MPHNGGRSTINMNYPNFGGDFPFLDYVKNGSTWSYSNNGYYQPDRHDADGWVTSIPGGIFQRTYVAIPTPAQRPGNYILDWTGSAPSPGFASTVGTLLSGSLSGTNGRAVFSNTSAGYPYIAQQTVGSPIPKFRFFHEDDEALLDSGETFGVTFKQKLSTIGMIRFLNVCSPPGSSNIFKWSHVAPTTHYSVAGIYFPPDMFVADGSMTNSGDDYSVTVPGFVEAQGNMFSARINATTSTQYPRMRVNGGSYYPILTWYGGLAGGQLGPTVGIVASFVFEEGIAGGVWLMHGGGTYYQDRGIESQWHPDLCLKLCAEVGAHPWWNLPLGTVDPISDYTENLIALNKTYQATHTWMKPVYEVGNEVWNTFGPTYYGGMKEGFREPGLNFLGWDAWTTATSYVVGDCIVYNDVPWICKLNHTSSSTNQIGSGAQRFTYWKLGDQNQWYGRCCTNVGKLLDTEYGGDRTKYVLALGVNQQGTQANSNGRMESNNLVAETGLAGDAAKFWVTHVTSSSYWESSHWGTANEITWADEYATATAARKAELLANYLFDQSGANYSFDDTMVDLQQWYDWTKAYNSDVGLIFYEGGYGNFNELNSPSGVPSANVIAFRYASWHSEILVHMVHKQYADLERMGGVFPVQFFLCSGGFGGIWAAHYPTLLDTPRKVWDGLTTYDLGQRRFRATTS